MTPCKVQKCCSTQKSVKDVSSSALCGKERVDPLGDMIPDHLQRHIFSFLLAKPIPPLNPKTLKEKERPYDEFRDHFHNISLVSKQWKTILGDFVNESAPPEILTPRELAEVKSKVFSLDLSTEFIHEMFEKLIQMKWPPHLKEREWGDTWEIDPLETVMEHFESNVFVKMVEDEYKRFLVLKCVQHLAVDKKLGEESRSWLEPIQPGPLVSLFWHAHILDVKKYAKDCNFLVGDVFEYTGHCEDTTETSCSLSEQHERIFAFEKSFLKHNTVCFCRLPGSEEKCASLTARNNLFGSTIKMDNLGDEIDEFNDGDDGCPHVDEVTGLRGHDSDLYCDGECCLNCCVFANKFDYSDKDFSFSDMGSP